jgi:hypothetical protein
MAPQPAPLAVRRTASAAAHGLEFVALLRILSVYPARLPINSKMLNRSITLSQTTGHAWLVPVPGPRHWQSVTVTVRARDRNRRARTVTHRAAAAEPGLRRRPRPGTQHRASSASSESPLPAGGVTVTFKFKLNLKLARRATLIAESKPQAE